MPSAVQRAGVAISVQKIHTEKETTSTPAASKPSENWVNQSSTPPLDLQLNGYCGIDFNADDLPLASIRGAVDSLRDDGGGQCLATIITDSLDRMCARIARLRAAIESDPVIRSTIVGIHVEGPFINPEPGYHGAHPRRHVQVASTETAQQLVDAGGGWVRLLTLAPEMDPGLQTTRKLAALGIKVSAGHCNPSIDLLHEAVDAGLQLFTHLGNGCPSVLPRHDNVIQRVLACQRLPFVMFIADGVHIPAMALGNYLKCVELDRVIAVTDATSAAGMGPGRYQLAGQEVIVDSSGAAWSPDRTHLIGSTATMPDVRRFLGTNLQLPHAAVDQLTAWNPRRSMGW